MLFEDIKRKNKLSSNEKSEYFDKVALDIQNVNCIIETD